MGAFGQLVRASLREWRRDTTSLVWSMIFPVVLALVLGMLFSGSGTIFFRVGVVNDAGAAGEAMIAAFDHNQALHIHTGARQVELDALKRGQREAVVIIPAEFSTGQAGAVSPVQVEVLVDPTSPNAQGALSLVQQTLTALEMRLAGRDPLFTLHTTMTDANPLRSADIMLPGVLALSLMMIGLYVTAIPLVSLREKQVLRRMEVTPLTGRTLLAAQVVFRVVLALVQAGILVALSVGLFDLPLELRAVPALVALVVLGSGVFITLGYCLAALAYSEDAAQGAVSLVFLVFTLLSGVLLPLWRMPDYVRPIVDAIPLTYLADALRQVMVDANPDFSMTRNVSILIAWLVVCTLLALRFFRWEPRT